MYAVKGNEVWQGDKKLDECGGHAEAVASAQDRASSGGSVALGPTLGRAVALEFDDAQKATVDGRSASLKQMSESFSHNDSTFEAGSYIVLYEDTGKAEAYSVADFSGLDVVVGSTND